MLVLGSVSSLIQETSQIHIKKKNISSPKTYQVYLPGTCFQPVNFPTSRPPQICPLSNYVPSMAHGVIQTSNRHQLGELFQGWSLGRWSCRARQVSHPGWGWKVTSYVFILFSLLFLGGGEVGCLILWVFFCENFIYCHGFDSCVFLYKLQINFILHSWS